MSSVEPEEIFLTQPDGSSLGTHVDTIDVTTIIVDDITITGTLNGQAIAGQIMFTDAIQTVTNKSFEDDTNSFVSAVDPTVQIFFDAAGTAGTSSILTFTQTTDREYTVPDSGADCDFVMTAGTQTIAGLKTFTGAVFSWNDRERLYTTGNALTAGAVTADVYTIATTSNTAYLYMFDIIGATPAGVTTVWSSSVRAKNVAGVLTIGTEFNSWDDSEAALATSSVVFVVSGTNILIRVTGVAAQVITWRGSVREILSAF